MQITGPPPEQGHDHHTEALANHATQQSAQRGETT